jgi:enoyl-CoA hydratase
MTSPPNPGDTVDQAERLSYELREGIAVLTMDDGKVNALGPPMVAALDAALDRAEAEARAVLLVGRPGRFCAGFDLKALMTGVDNARALVRAGIELWLRLYTFPRPVVAACTGHALAGGALLLLTSDRRLGAVGEFKIGLNEVAINLPLPMLAQSLAADRLARNRLVEATVGATIYLPTEAVEVGFLDEVIMPDAVVERAYAEAKRYAALPAEPFRHTKAMMRAATVTRVRAALDDDILALTSG